MIVIDVNLISAVSRTRDCKLGVLVIYNYATYAAGHRGDYIVEAYRKGTKDFREATPIRRAKVRNHRRKAEPVWNLIGKALSALGYDTEAPDTRNEKGMNASTPQ